MRPASATKYFLLSMLPLASAAMVATGTASAATTSRALYVNTGTDSGRGTSSQNFEQPDGSGNTAAADDFKVPGSHLWTVDTVSVTGIYYNGSGPADSETVTIYKNNHKHLPGAIVARYENLTGTEIGRGSFKITIPLTRLRPGHYWISVVVNMPFFSGGQWAWGNMLEEHGRWPVWQNPGGTSCQTWTPERECFGPGLGDHFFSLEGKVTYSP